MGGKERGEVKGEYGGISGEEEGNVDYGEWCNPVSNMTGMLTRLATPFVNTFHRANLCLCKLA